MLYTNSIDTITFGLLCGVWVASEFLGPVRWSRSRKGKERGRSSVLAIVIVVGLLGLAFCVLAPVLLPGARIPWQPVFFTGLIIALLGMGWRWYAIVTLGRYFTAALMTHIDQQVVQHGPYRWVRHPSYGGVLLIATGLGLMIGNWASVAVLTVGMGAILLYRIPREERELLQHLGTNYQDYVQRTKRLIPFVF